MAPIVISQPTFLPWLGYFDLIDQASDFVVLDQVQFAKRSWQQRNQIVTAQGLKWVTVPVLVAGRRDQKISEVEISTTADFPRKMLRMIEQEYRKAPHFDTNFPAFEATVK
ncbi:MAG: WbqC family protein, partial [Acidimicrobiia bacterium]|nr:WbqC family protein [Acidimicrobiia bacterium]